MTFERALKGLKEGYKIRRTGWAKGSYLEILTDVKGVRTIRGLGFGAGGTHHHFCQVEILAEDWSIIDG